MIKFENTEVMGWEAAIRGMRNPMNSWEKSDSEYNVDWTDDSVWPHETHHDDVILGQNDHDLMMRLRNAGTDHRKFMRMITVYVDITAPLYWWKEFDTYKVGIVANSCSTMHKIADKEFTLDDFSHEHLLENEYSPRKTLLNKHGLGMLEDIIFILNAYRRYYLKTKDKKYWWQMIQLLPSSYNQKRTMMLNYEVLANIYKSRKNHKLDEWAEHKAEMIDVTTLDDLARGEAYPHLVEGVKGYFGFCDWIKTLPYFELITGEEMEKKENV